MKAHPFLLAALGAVVALSGCPSSKKTVVYATPDYQSWARTTDIELNYPIPGHQDRYRIPRMNAIGFSTSPTVEAGTRRWNFPEGTIIVKEIYATQRPAENETPIQLVMMVKAPRDPHAQGGWLWITRKMPGGSESVFMGNFCITCHANANERHPYGDHNPTEEFRDYVYFVPGEGSAALTPQGP
jgi:hypothetical protein